MQYDLVRVYFIREITLHVYNRSTLHWTYSRPDRDVPMQLTDGQFPHLTRKNHF